MSLYKKAFTLTETIIVLLVIGIIAVVTVPQLVRHQIEVENKTKLKKSMSVYDMAIQRMVIENDFKSENQFDEWADSATKNDCRNTSAYFKINSGSGCLFRTADGVTWYIGNIRNPIISVKKLQSRDEAIERANSETDKSTFYMFTFYDKSTGAFRPNDLLYAKTGASQSEYNKLKELYDWIGNKIRTSEESAEIANNTEQSGNPVTPQEDTQEEETQTPAETRQVCDSANCCATSYSGQKCAEVTGSSVKYIDSSGRTTNSGSGCTSETECTSWNNSIYDDLGDGNEIVYTGWTCSGTNMGSCPEPQGGNAYTFRMNGEVKADIVCSGTSCTCAGRRWPDLACTPENIQKMNVSMQNQGLPYQIQQ